MNFISVDFPDPSFPSIQYIPAVPCKQSTKSDQDIVDFGGV